MQNVLAKEVDGVHTKDTSELAVRYLGRALLAVIIGIIICFLTTIGYNTYISISQEKIEVQATNSNLFNDV